MKSRGARNWFAAGKSAVGSPAERPGGSPRAVQGRATATNRARWEETVHDSLAAIRSGRISKAVLSRGLDSNTAFEIVSIDIADVDVGENIGARLQADQAEADTRVARAKAEERRAFAIAREQEMKAAVSENRARVVMAEAEVPRAMAEAFRQGNFDSVSRNGR